MIARRLLASIPTLLGVATLVFAILHAVPGDPIDLLLGESAAPVERQALRDRLGLDRPLLVQYGLYLEAAARGDLGHSIRSGRPVSALIAERWPATALLAALAVAIASAVAIPLGTLAAARPGGVADRVARAIALVSVAAPTFWTGPMLVLVFAVGLGALPVAGSDTAAHAVLPALTLGLSSSGLLLRMTRVAVLDALACDYARTAAAKGAPRARILLVHALPNAGTTILSVVGLQLGGALAGSVVTETIFAWPGLGRLVVEAIQARDYPVVQGAVLAIATSYVLVNLLVDLLHLRLDPVLADADAE